MARMRFAWFLWVLRQNDESCLPAPGAPQVVLKTVYLDAD